MVRGSLARCSVWPVPGLWRISRPAVKGSLQGDKLLARDSGEVDVASIVRGDLHGDWSN